MNPLEEQKCREKKAHLSKVFRRDYAGFPHRVQVHKFFHNYPAFLRKERELMEKNIPFITQLSPEKDFGYIERAK